MRRICSIALLPATIMLACAPAHSGKRTIEFPCSQNQADKRVILDGTAWDEKLRNLGYELAEGEYVPYDVLSFTKEKVVDEDWIDGMCRIRLLPVRKY